MPQRKRVRTLRDTRGSDRVTPYEFERELRSHAAASARCQRYDAQADGRGGSQFNRRTPSGRTSNAFQSRGFIVNCPLMSIFANKYRNYSGRPPSDTRDEPRYQNASRPAVLASGAGSRVFCYRLS